MVTASGVARASGGTRTRRQQHHHVTPSLVKSETFLVGLFVLGLAIYVPYMLKTTTTTMTTGTTTGKARYVVNTTQPIAGVRDSFAIPSQPVVVVPPTQIMPPPPGASVPVGQQQQQQPPIAAAAAGAGGATLVQEGRRPAPITYLFPYLLSFSRTIFGLFSYIPIFLYRILHAALLRPLYYPLALTLAVIRPITLLLEITYAAFLHTPLSILSWIVREAIYPLYVFSGMAAVTGALLGYSASHIPRSAMFITERVRTQISKSSRFGQLRPLLTSPAYGAALRSMKRGAGGFSISWRSPFVNNNNHIGSGSGENGTDSDDTTSELASRVRGLRGFVTRR